MADLNAGLVVSTRAGAERASGRRSAIGGDDDDDDDDDSVS